MPPFGAVLPSAFHDKDAEDVKQKQLEEKAEERETFSMGQEDPASKEPEKFELETIEGMKDASIPKEHATGMEISGSASSRPKRPGEVEVTSVFDDEVDSSCLPSMETQVDATQDVGLTAAVTPPVISGQLPPTPRQQHSTRTHETEMVDDHESKRAKIESQEKQKINQLREYNESMIRTVKVGTDEFATTDDYEHEMDVNDSTPDVEFWEDEDNLEFKDVPDALWSSASLEKQPPPLEQWVDQLADEIEIQRLLSMGVLQRKEECLDEISGSLTTRFVYDWRVKDHPSGSKMWMRRSRFVAREFATDRRSDTYSPASGCHSTNLIPILYLKMLADSLDSVDSFGSDGNSPYQVVLAALDIKDAFLQVPQVKLVMVSLYNQQYVSM